MNPNQLKAWQDFLSLHFETENYEYIRSICQDALRYFPEESSFWYYYALSYAIEKKYLDALQAYQTCLRQVGEKNKTLSSRIFGHIGDLYYQLGEVDKSFEYYEKSLNADANNYLILNNYAYHLSVIGKDLERAEIMSRQALRAEPDNSTYLDTYAWILFQQKSYSMAKIYIERSLINDNGASSEIYEHYGDILWFCNDFDEAKKQWRKALNLTDNPSEILKLKVIKESYVKP